jgi:hypothetical protein
MHLLAYLFGLLGAASSAARLDRAQNRLAHSCSSRFSSKVSCGAAASLRQASANCLCCSAVRIMSLAPPVFSQEATSAQFGIRGYVGIGHRNLPSKVSLASRPGRVFGETGRGAL